MALVGPELTMVKWVSGTLDCPTIEDVATVEVALERWLDIGR